jgi:exodeoxyribonuclease-1
MIAPASMLADDEALNMQLDLALARQHFVALKSQSADILQQKLMAVFDRETINRPQDVEKSLYSGGFLNQHDKKLCLQVQRSQGFDLDTLVFDDARLNTLLFRYRARNFPDSLNEAEIWRWRDFCHQRFSGEDALANNSIPQLQTAIQALAIEHESDEQKMAVLKALWAWCEKLT